MLLEEIHKHKHDSRIKFNPKLHQYYVDGKDSYISVTELIKEFFSKFDTNAVIEKMVSSPNWDKSKYFGMTKTQIEKKWETLGNVSSSLGRLLHDTIENYYNELPIIVPPEISIEFQQFLRFHSTMKWVPYRSEWCIFHKDFHVAGTIDMIFYDPITEKFHLFDWKRTPSFKKTNPFQTGSFPLHCLDDCKFNHYSLQLNIYKYILEKKYGLPVESMTLVAFHPDNKEYIKESVPNQQELVEDLLHFQKSKFFKHS